MTAQFKGKPGKCGIHMMFLWMSAGGRKKNVFCYLGLSHLPSHNTNAMSKVHQHICITGNKTLLFPSCRLSDQTWHWKERAACTGHHHRDPDALYCIWCHNSIWITNCQLTHLWMSAIKILFRCVGMVLFGQHPKERKSIKLNKPRDVSDSTRCCWTGELKYVFFFRSHERMRKWYI